MVSSPAGEEGRILSGYTKILRGSLEIYDNNMSFVHRAASAGPEKFLGAVGDTWSMNFLTKGG